MKSPKIYEIAQNFDTLHQPGGPVPPRPPPPSTPMTPTFNQADLVCQSQVTVTLRHQQC